MGASPSSPVPARPATASTTTQNRWQHAANEVFDALFGLDTRALAVLRIALGGLTIADLSIRATDLLAHYTDFGILPRNVMIEFYTGPWEYSFHHFSGNWIGVGLLFLLHACLGAAFAVGYKTRLTGLLCWVLHISLQNRNPMVLHSGDVLFRMLFFWSLFLPMGERYSVDAALDPKRETPRTRLANIATFAILLQVFAEYFFAAQHKVGPEWHSEGSAVYYALQVEQFTTRAGLWFRETFRAFLAPMTLGVWWFELVGPFFLFAPPVLRQVRLITVGLFVGMHLGFSVFLGIGIFPFFCWAALIPFFPTVFWDRIDAWLAGRERAAQIVYDGECLFCEKMAKIVRMMLALRRAKLRNASEEPLLRKMVEQKSSWIVIDAAGEKHFRWDAFVTLLAASPWARPLAPLARLWPFRYLGDRAYRFVAGNRPRWARVSAVLLPYAPQDFRLEKFWGGLAAVCLFTCVAWNVETLNEPPSIKAVPAGLRPMALIFRLDQRWNMFSRPILEDGWLEIPGKLDDGRDFDVYRHRMGAPLMQRPAVLSDNYPNERWQKYLMNLQMRANQNHRLYYGRYLCRRANLGRKPSDRLKSFEIILMMERITPEGRNPAERVPLWKHECY